MVLESTKKNAIYSVNVCLLNFSYADNNAGILWQVVY